MRRGGQGGGAQQLQAMGVGAQGLPGNALPSFLPSGSSGRDGGVPWAAGSLAQLAAMGKLRWKLPFPRQRSEAVEGCEQLSEGGRQAGAVTSVPRVALSTSVVAC